MAVSMEMSIQGTISAEMVVDFVDESKTYIDIAGDFSCGAAIASDKFLVEVCKYGQPTLSSGTTEERFIDVASTGKYLIGLTIGETFDTRNGRSIS